MKTHSLRRVLGETPGLESLFKKETVVLRKRRKQYQNDISNCQIGENNLNSLTVHCKKVYRNVSFNTRA